MKVSNLRDSLTITIRKEFRASELNEELDKQPASLFHPQRIAMMLSLYYSGAVDFPQIKHDLNLTDGALASHLKVLTDEGLIIQKKERVGTRMRKTNMITMKGMDTVEKFLKLMYHIEEERERVTNEQP